MAFDPKMIQLFDGSDTGQSVIEWIEKAELIGSYASIGWRICSVSAAEQRKEDFTCIKNALLWTPLKLGSNF